MKLIRNLFLLLLLLAVLAGVALALLPARQAIDYLGGRVGPLELGEVSGTIWNGRAAQARLNGQPIGALSWTLSPWGLPSRRVDADLQLRGDTWNGDAAVRVLRDRTVHVRDLVLRFPARQLEPALDIPALVMRGDVELNVPAAELRGAFPTAIQGSATWRSAGVAGSAEAVFGDLITDFASDGRGGVQGTLRDGGGPLQAQGSYQAGLAGYRADVTLRARDGNPQVTEALQYIGQAQPDGSVRLEIRGQLLGGF